MNAALPAYPAYKDSGVPWLGRIPAHWTQAPGRACYCEKKVPNAGMRETTVLSLSYGQVVVKPPEKLHGLVPASFETYQIIDPGDIVVRPTDLQNDWNSLRFGLSRHRGIITSAYICLHTEDSVTREYGHLLLHAYDLKKVFYGLGSGLRQNLDWRDFKYLPCLVPPLPEQHAITRYLDHVDRRIRRYIRAKQRLIALLEEQKQAVIHQAVTGQIDVRTGRPYPAYKPSGVEWLGDVPEHWAEVAVGQVAESLQTGPFGSQLHASDYVEDGIPVINPLHLRGGQICADSKFSVSENTALRLSRHKLELGDIVIGRRGEMGRCGLVRASEVGWLCGTGSMRLRPKPGFFDPEYLLLLLSSKRVGEYLSLVSVGATMENLNPSIVSRVRLPCPPIAEQKRIIAAVSRSVSTMKRAIERTQREIALLREYRTRLIADVVTGQVDVRAAAAQLPAEVEEFDALDEAEAELVEDEEGESQVMAG